MYKRAVLFLKSGHKHIRLPASLKQPISEFEHCSSTARLQKVHCSSVPLTFTFPFCSQVARVLRHTAGVSPTNYF